MQFGIVASDIEIRGQEDAKEFLQRGLLLLLNLPANAAEATPQKPESGAATGSSVVKRN